MVGATTHGVTRVRNRTDGAGPPVARLVAPVILRLGLLVFAIAIICIAGVLASTQSVSYITDELEPAAGANQDILQDLTDMDAAVSAWARSGDPVAQADFRLALERLPEHQQSVRDFARDDAELAPIIDSQELAADAWLDQYALRRIAAAGGPSTFQLGRYQVGQTLFDDIRALHVLTEESFDEQSQRAKRDARFRFRATIVAVLLLAALACFLVGSARAKLTNELSEPLAALESAVHRMTKHDLEARAEVRGPKEVRSVATALNDFADGRARANAVEGRIQDELRVLDTAKDDFVSNVSHELRTPLTTISGYLEMVAEEFEGELDPRHERMLDATRRNVTRLKVLIDDLLALSKAENRATDLEASDVLSMIRDAVTDVRITAARRGIRVEVTAPGEALFVLCDRAMLMRAFLNVLTNAVKFSHDEGVVEVEVTRHLRQVEVAVRDSGIGIPRAELDRLGSRFFRASNAVTNEIAGTGLGLRIVQTIVDKHAGDVLIESTEGIGTTVFIRLGLHGDAVVIPMSEPRSSVTM